jgi:hypothetical protein
MAVLVVTMGTLGQIYVPFWVTGMLELISVQFEPASVE